MNRGRQADLALGLLDRRHVASPSETPGARLNEIVTDGNCP